MKMKEMFPSEYLKGDDIKGRKVRAVIEGGKLEEMGDGSFKPVLRFRNSKKGLVLNKTNGDTIAEVYGDDSDAWIGQTIVLYFDPKVSYAGKRTGGIRVEIPEDGRTRKREEPEPEEELAPPPDDSDAPSEDSDDSIPF